jgi:hypothetical protein
MTTCSRCKLEKSDSYFSKNRNKKNRLNAWCKACWVDYRRENAAYYATYQVRYRAENPEYIAALNADWMSRNADHQRRMKKRYRAEKPHVQAALNAKYRASVKRATPSWADLKAIEGLYEEAARMTRETGIEHHVDHFYPLQSKVMCGLHVETNLRVIPAKINQAKGNRVRVWTPPSIINIMRPGDFACL